MNRFLRRSLVAPAAWFALVAGCANSQSDLEKHASACQSGCASVHSQCSTDPAFADPWTLACEVACSLDFTDETRPFEVCMNEASTCAEWDACVNAGPAATGPSAGPDEDTDASSSTTGSSNTSTSGSASTSGAASDTDPVDGSTTTGEVEGHPCCGTSADCVDAEVLECTCGHIPSCCTGPWGEACASVAVANGCIDDGCGSLEGWTDFNCSCSTTSVFCPDDPFVSQLIFGTDACGLVEADALAIAQSACEQGGNNGCSVVAGSCSCECFDYGDACGYQPQ